MTTSRTEKSIRNIKVGTIAQMLNVVLSFLMRFFLIQILGREYLGINATFSSILTVLSLSELGIGEAISFLLYKPLSENDRVAVKRILTFLKKVYIIIFISIIALGFIAAFFLPLIIKDSMSIDGIYYIYALYVFNAAFGFIFGGHKRILLSSDQKNYVVSTISSICIIIGHIIQIIILLVTKNYIFYFCGQLFITISSNIACSIYVNKKYTFLKTTKLEKMTPEEKKSIKKNVSALIIQKFNAVVIQSIDVLILSSVFSVEMSGTYSNYSLIIGQVTTFTSLCFNVSLGSVGNLLVTSDPDYCKKVFKNTLFVTFWVYCICGCLLYYLMDDAILILANQTYLLPKGVLFVLVINFFIFGLRNNVITYKNAFGLYWETKFLPLICGVLNIVLSFGLSKLFGYIGIFIATTIVYSIMILRETYVLFKYGFKDKKYSWGKDLFENILGFLIILFIFICLDKIVFSNIVFIDIFIRLIIALLSSVTIIYIFKHNDESGISFLNMLLKKIFHIKSKVKEKL